MMMPGFQIEITRFKNYASGFFIQPSFKPGCMKLINRVLYVILHCTYELIQSTSSMLLVSHLGIRRVQG